MKLYSLSLRDSDLLIRYASALGSGSRVLSDDHVQAVFSMHDVTLIVLVSFRVIHSS